MKFSDLSPPVTKPEPPEKLDWELTVTAGPVITARIDTEHQIKSFEYNDMAVAIKFENGAELSVSLKKKIADKPYVVIATRRMCDISLALVPSKANHYVTI